MARGVTIDLIVDPKGAIQGIGEASGESNKFTDALGKAGQIGVAAIAAVATAVVAATGALAAATVGAGKYADEILEASTNTNLGTDTLQAYRYAAEQLDVSFETFVSSQGKFTKSMQTATSGTGPAAEGFAALGLSVTDANGQLVDSETLYWQAIDALGAVENETLRTALAQQLFGKSGAEMNSIIAQGSAGFAELSAEAAKNGAIMSGPQLEALGEFDDKMQGLTSTIDAAKNALGLTLLPILDQLAGDGTSALGEFSSALLAADGDLTKAGPAFESLGTNVAAALTNAVPKILEVGSSLVNGLIEGIVSNGPKLIQTAIPLLVTFVTGILGMLPTILDAGFKILIALVQGIAAALPVLIPAAVTAIVGLVGALIANLPLLLDAGLQLLAGLTQGLITALPILIAALPEIIIGIITFVIDAIPQLIEAGIALLTALIGALPEIITAIVAAIPQIIIGLNAAILGSIPQLIQAGIQLLVALVAATPQIITEIVRAVPQIVSGLVNAIVGSVPQLASAGWSLIQGLWQGISSAGGWLWGQVSGFIDNLVSNIQSALGIHSPSTVMADSVGEPMGQGVGVGFMGSLAALKPQIKSAVGGLGDIAQDAIGGSLSVNARASVESSGGFVGGGGGGNVYITFQSLMPSAEGGRAVVNALQEYVRTGGTGLKAVLGNG